MACSDQPEWSWWILHATHLIFYKSNALYTSLKPPFPNNDIIWYRFLSIGQEFGFPFLSANLQLHSSLSLFHSLMKMSFSISSDLSFYFNEIISYFENHRLNLELKGVWKGYSFQDDLLKWDPCLFFLQLKFLIYLHCFNFNWFVLKVSINQMYIVLLDKSPIYLLLFFFCDFFQLFFQLIYLAFITRLGQKND